MGDSVDGLLTEVARQSLWADRIEKELQMTDMTPVKFMTSPGKVNPMPKKPTQHNPVASTASILSPTEKQAWEEHLNPANKPKFAFPQTVGSEYGFFQNHSKIGKATERNLAFRRRWDQSKGMCAITKFADDYYTLQRRSMYAKQPGTT